MRNFAGKFVFCCIGVWLADENLSGLQIGAKRDRWPMKLALILVLGLLMAAVDALIKPALNMVNLPAMMLTYMIIWTVLGTLSLWLIAQLFQALELPVWLTRWRWDGVVAAWIIGWWASLMEYLGPPPAKK